MIFNHATVLVDDPPILAGVRDLLSWLNGIGVTVAILSTDPFDIEDELAKRDLPGIDFFLTRDDIPQRKSKGSPLWVEEVSRRAGIPLHELGYVGGDVLDWRTAINTPTFYLHAQWVGRRPREATALEAIEPSGVRFALSHLIMPPPRWEFSLDDSETSLHVRSLLNANAVLPATSPESFRLQDVFTYKTKVMVEESNARDVLGLHAVSSLYVEGLIRRNSFFCVYPSSRPGRVNQVLKEFVAPASRLFHAYFREDLLVRSEQAADTSLERYRATRQGREANVSFTTQANTVHLNPKYRRSLRGRSVVVFDDFTTTGLSLDWARNLLQAAGAGEVTLVAIGKYSNRHNAYVPSDPRLVSPFEAKDYSEADFSLRELELRGDESVPPLLESAFAAWREDRFLP